MLAEIKAVSPKYPWARLEPLYFDPEAKVTPADAIRLATAIVRGERFCYGNIEPGGWGYEAQRAAGCR